MKHSWLLYAVVVVGLTACSSEEPAAVEGCRSNTDCESGFICQQTECRKLCVRNAQCTGDQVCGPDGLCTIVPGGKKPVVENVSGNNADDAQKIADGLVIVGEGLGDVTVSLAAESEYELAIRSQAQNRVEAVLPTEIVSGQYALAVANQVGTDEEQVTLTLPELDGETLITRINGEATTKLDPALLPEHDHDERYLRKEDTYSRTQADETFATPSQIPVVATGGNYIPNADFTRGDNGLYGWSLVDDGPASGSARVDVTAEGRAGVFAIENPRDARLTLTSTERVPINRDATYEVTGTFRRVSNNGNTGTISLGVRQFDAAGSDIGDIWVVRDANELNEETGAPRETYSLAEWQRFVGEFGAGTDRPFAKDARTMDVVAVLNNNPDGVQGFNPFQVQGLGIYDADPQGATYALSVSVPEQAGSINSGNIGEAGPSGDDRFNLPICFPSMGDIEPDRGHMLEAWGYDSNGGHNSCVEGLPDTDDAPYSFESGCYRLDFRLPNFSTSHEIFGVTCRNDADSTWRYYLADFDRNTYYTDHSGFENDGGLELPSDVGDFDCSNNGYACVKRLR